MAAVPESFIYTSTGGILRLNVATPENIRGLATIGLATCLALVIVGINDRVSLLHTPRLGIDWLSIRNEVAYVGEDNIERVYIAYNPLHINELDQGYLALYHYFLEEIGTPVFPFQVIEIFLGRIAYNRNTRTMETPAEDANLESENSELYCYIFSLNNYFAETSRLYLHYNGLQWNAPGPTLLPYPLQIYQQNIDLLNENTEENRIQIRNTILHDVMHNANGVPRFFSGRIMSALNQNNIHLLQGYFGDIIRCLFIYATEIPGVPPQPAPIPAQVNIGQNPNILLAPPHPNLGNQEAAADPDHDNQEVVQIHHVPQI